MRFIIAVISLGLFPAFGQLPKPILDLAGVYRGTWTMYGVDENGAPVKRMAWTDVMTASAPTVADGKAFVSTVDEITFENSRIPPATVKGREGWFLAPDGKTLQDYFIETNGQVQRVSKIGDNVWVYTAPIPARELAQLGVNGALSGQHTLVKVVTREDGAETHRITRLSTVNWKDSSGKNRWMQFVSLEGVHRRQ